MTSTLEVCLKKNLNDLQCGLLFHCFLTKAEHIGIIVRPRELRLLYRMNVSAPNITETIRGKAHTRARSADQNSTIGTFLIYCTGHFISKVGIVNRIGPMSAIIDELAARLFQSLHDSIFQLNSAVIGPDCDAVRICTH